MYELASARVKPNSSKQALNLIGLKEKIDVALESKRMRELRKKCHVTTLPFEILSEIFQIATDCSASTPTSKFTIVSESLKPNPDIVYSVW